MTHFHTKYRVGHLEIVENQVTTSHWHTGQTCVQHNSTASNKTCSMKIIAKKKLEANIAHEQYHAKDQQHNRNKEELWCNLSQILLRQQYARYNPFDCMLGA